MSSDIRTTEPNNLWEALECRSPKSAAIIKRSFEQMTVDQTRADFKEKYGFVPSNITLSPTFSCNLRCADCYSASEDTKKDVLPDRTVDSAIHEGKSKWAIPFFTISGGESLLHAINIAERHPDVPIQVYTNGTLITDAVADKMAGLGNIIPFISVEGMQEETDRVRGTGVYERVQKAMDILTRKGVVWGISFKLTSGNAHVYNSNDFLNGLIEKGALLGRFLTYMPTGRNADFSKVPNGDKRKQQAEALQRVVEEGKLFYGLDYLNNPGLVKGCAAAGLRYVHVGPSGDVFPCVFIPISARFNLTAAYDGQYDGLAVDCLEQILLQDPMLQVVRRIAATRDDSRCCLVLDEPREFQNACLELARRG